MSQLSIPDIRLVPANNRHPAHAWGMVNATSVAELNTVLFSLQKDAITKELTPVFLDTVRSMISAFEQPSETDLKELKNHVFRLVTIADAPVECKQLVEALKAKTVALSTVKQNQGSESKLDLSKAERDQAKHLTDVEKLLKKTPEERLSLALSFPTPCKAGSETEAHRLQIILSAMDYESELLPLVSSFVEKGLFVQRSNKSYEDATVTLVPISSQREIARFEVPSTISSFDDYALCVHYQQIVSLVTRLNSRLSNINSDYPPELEQLRKIRIRLEAAKARESHFARILLLHLDHELVPVIFCRSLIALSTKYFSEFFGSAFVRLQVAEKSLQDFAAPCFKFIQVPLAGLIQKLLKEEKFDTLDTRVLTSLQRACHIWNQAQSKQVKMYAIAMDKLRKNVFSKGNNSRKNSSKKSMRYLNSLISKNALASKLGIQSCISRGELESLYAFMPNLSLTPVETGSPVPVYAPKRQQPRGNKTKHDPLSKLFSSIGAFPSSSRDLSKPTQLDVTEEKGFPVEKMESEVRPLPKVEKQIPFTMAPRVRRWTKCTEFDAEVFPGYLQEDFPRKRRYHGFSLAVDQYYDIGFKAEWTNSKTGAKNHRYIIPAEFEYGQEVERGAIIYCIDDNRVCYHRYFHRDLGEEELIQKSVTNSFYDLDFPELAVQEVSQGFKSQITETEGRVEVEEDAVFGTVEIRQVDGLIIRLISTQPSFLRDAN